MKPMKSLLITALVGLLPLAAAADEAKSKQKEKPAPEAKRIEVCFVLDTTGSMSGLIAGAKEKIWSIANQMTDAKPLPDLKMGLIGYRDRGGYLVDPTGVGPSVWFQQITQPRTIDGHEDQLLGLHDLDELLDVCE